MKFGRLPFRLAFESLKFRITFAGMAALILGIGLITAVLVQQAERDTLSAHRDRELSEAVKTAQVVSRRLTELQRSLGTVTPLLDRATVDSDDALIRFITRQSVLQGMFANLFVARADGTLRLYTDDSGVKRPALNFSDREYFRRTVRDATPVLSEPVPGKVSGEPVVVVTVPVADAHGVYAVLGGGLRLVSRDLLADLVDAQEGDPDTLVVVSDAAGHVIAHPDKRRLMHSIAAEPRLSQAYLEWVGRGAPVETQGLQLPQDGQVVSVGGVAGTDWVVWRVHSVEELMMPLHEARRQALLWAAAIIAALAAGMLLGLGWLLRPLGQLERRAQSVFDPAAPAGDASQGWPSCGGEIGQLSDVLRRVMSERSALEQANTVAMRRLESVMRAAPVGIAFTRGHRFELVNAEFCKLFRATEAQLIGQFAQSVMRSNEDWMQLAPGLRKSFEAGVPYMGEWELLRGDRTRFRGHLRGQLVDPADWNGAVIWTVDDVTELAREREALQWSATHDPLTGLVNRKVFERRAGELIGSDTDRTPCAIVFIDLDHFKPINDSAGHAAGDAMLKEVATVMLERVRTGDLVVRLGGDEFALLLEDCSHEQAMRISDNIRRDISAIALEWEGRTLSLSASLGVASLNRTIDTLPSWLRAADTACYSAKSAGRGTVRAAVATYPSLRVVAAQRGAWGA
jgi:diguanylate cyclase (GGDEF)-like protein